VKRLLKHGLRHSGARALAREPGIHNQSCGVWIPGARALLAPRNDEEVVGGVYRIVRFRLHGRRQSNSLPGRVCRPSAGGGALDDEVAR